MEQWITQTLPILESRQLDASTASTVTVVNVVLETLPDGGTITIPLSNVVNLLGSTVPPTHSELSALPIAGAGWQQYFDAWKAAGYIS